jgi:hypothetical protein
MLWPGGAPPEAVKGEADPALGAHHGGRRPVDEQRPAAPDQRQDSVESLFHNFLASVHGEDNPRIPAGDTETVGTAPGDPAPDDEDRRESVTCAVGLDGDLAKQSPDEGAGTAKGPTTGPEADDGEESNEQPGPSRNRAEPVRFDDVIDAVRSSPRSGVFLFGALAVLAALALVVWLVVRAF